MPDNRELISHELLAKAIRKHQCSDKEVGLWWTRFHQFMSLTIYKFWFDEMPLPILSMGFTEGVGHYDHVDSIGLLFRINLNPFKLKSGIEAAETLAHELVHLHMDFIGEPTMLNVHCSKFHDLMMDVYGIRTEGEDGKHYGNNGIWDDWMEANRDLELEKFKLVGGE